MPSQNSNMEEGLGFAEAVAQYIAPMLMAYGFIVAGATSCEVKFQSPSVALSVLHDNAASYEIDVVFARRVQPWQQYGLPDMLNVVLGPGCKEEGFFQASEHDRVVTCIKTVAKILRTYGENVLAGDPIMYQRMEEIRQQLSKAFTKQVVQRPIRSAAEDAWRTRDYATVGELYHSIEADLTPVEKKRLAYAKSHSSNT